MTTPNIDPTSRNTKDESRNSGGSQSGGSSGGSQSGGSSGGSQSGGSSGGSRSGGSSQSAGTDPNDKESTNPNPDRNTEIGSNGPDSSSNKR